MSKMTRVIGLRLTAVLWLLVLAAMPSPSLAQTKDSAVPALLGMTAGDFIIKDFHFNSGEVLPELRLHYVTLGTPHRNASGEIDNAVLLLHSTGSDTTEFFEADFSGPLIPPRIRGRLDEF